MTKVKVFVYGRRQQRRRRRRRGYDNSSPDFRHGELKNVLPCERSCHRENTSLLVRKLWPRLKFLKSRLNFKVKVTNYGTMCKVLSQWKHICNMKALSLLVWKLWPRLKFLFKPPDRRATTLAPRTYLSCLAKRIYVALSGSLKRIPGKCTNSWLHKYFNCRLLCLFLLKFGCTKISTHTVTVGCINRKLKFLIYQGNWCTIDQILLHY